jgi:hypothetical protein
MSPKAFIDGRTLLFDGERIALDAVSGVVAIDRFVTDYRRDWAKHIDRALNMGLVVLIGLAVWQLVSGTWSSLALAFALTAIWIVATVLFPFLLTACGLAYQKEVHAVRLDLRGDEKPSLLAETPDKAFRDRVAATLREVIENQRSAYQGSIDFHESEISINEVGASQSVAFPVASGVQI